MDCELALEALSAALDGELSPQETRELNAHLDQCPACRALSQELSALHDACGALEVTPPLALKDQIMAHLPTQEPVKIVPIQPKKPVRHWQRWVAMAATFALVCMAAWQLPRFLFTKGPDASPENMVPDSVESAATAEGPAGSIAPFSEVGGADTEASAQPAGGADSFNVTGYDGEESPVGSASYSGYDTEEAPMVPAARSADVSGAPAEIPVQGVLTGAAQPFTDMTNQSADPSAATDYGALTSAKVAPSASVPAADVPSGAPQTKQADMAAGASAPQPTTVPEAAPATSSRVLLTSQNVSPDQDTAGVEEATAAQADSFPVEFDDGGSSTTQLMLTSAAAPSDNVDPSAGLYTRSGGTPPQSALTAELPPETEPEQSQVNTEEFEEVVPAEDALPIYCGQITLLEGQLLGDYPKEELSDGTVRYTLPAHQFWALLQQLEDSGLSYQFQPTGVQINPAAAQGLVILSAN